MKTIIAVQHTQSIHHTNGMVGSWTDWNLSDLGITQAHIVGANLKKEIGGKGYVLYSSDLLRAKHTARIIGSYIDTEPVLTGALRERNLGRAVGQSIQWLRDNMECQEKTVDDRMFSDAESRRDVWNRLIPFYNSVLCAEHERIILIAHGELMGFLCAMWLGFDVEALDKFKLWGQAGGVSVLQEDAFGRAVKRFGDMSYLKEQG